MSIPHGNGSTLRRLIHVICLIGLSSAISMRAVAQIKTVKSLEETSEVEANRPTTDFIERYARDFPIRKARYSTNRKIVWIERSFLPEPLLELGVLESLQHSRVEYLANENRSRMEMIISNDRIFDEHPQIAKVKTESEEYCLRWHCESGRYEIRIDANGTYQSDIIRQTRTGMPFPVKLSDYTVLLENLNPIFNNQLKESTMVDAIAVEPCRWRNQSLVRVTFRTAQSLIDAEPLTPIRFHHGYFDPEHAWICHGMEAEPLPIDNVPEIKRYTNCIEYKHGPEGYPLPTRFSKAAEYRNGKVVPILEIEIESYDRAFPEDGEISLEYFGITPGIQPTLVVELNDDVFFLNRTHWMWIAPLLFVLTLVGTFIGRIAMKSQKSSEPIQQAPSPNY